MIPPCLPWGLSQAALDRANGRNPAPVIDGFHRNSLSMNMDRQASSISALRGRLPGLHQVPGSLADDLLLLPDILYLTAKESEPFCAPDSLLSSGPRGIRTLGLLNAIEARSQLRYGPLFNCQTNQLAGSGLASSGPGGIRTLDLFSAIEARSQLRYRPLLEGSKILTQGDGPVKA